MFQVHNFSVPRQTKLAWPVFHSSDHVPPRTLKLSSAGEQDFAYGPFTKDDTHEAVAIPSLTLSRKSSAKIVRVLLSYQYVLQAPFEEDSLCRILRGKVVDCASIAGAG